MLRFGKSGKLRHFRSPEIPFGVQWSFDGSEGGGGGAGGGGGVSDADKERRNLESLLAKKNGDGVALAAQLLGENNDLREDRRKLHATVADLQAKVPAEGTVVLTGDDAKAWNAYRELGTADELKAAKTERDSFKADKERLEAENASVKRDSILRDVASEAGYKLSVFKDRDERTPGLEYLKKPVTLDGKAVEQWFVKFKDGEGESAPLKEVALDEFAAQKWADFLPALKAEAGQEESGTRHVAQGSGGTSGKGSVFERIRKSAEETAKSVEQGPTLEERLHMRTSA